MFTWQAACSEAQILNDRSIKLELTHKVNQIIYSAGPSRSQPSSTAPVSSRKRSFNIHQRLKELFLEECRNAQPCLPLPLKHLKRGSRLLEKLVEKDNLNTLIVNLYPGNKGYSLSLRLQGKVPAALGSQAGRNSISEPTTETMRWPYSDEELLNCIDNEEIPANLVDLLEANHSELFYHGCVIAEVRDFRLSFPLFNYESHHVLLKPTTQSIISDVNSLSFSHEFNSDDRLSLESQIVLATAPPLCLDPNPAVSVLINNLQNKKLRLNVVPLRRAARKFSQVSVNRKRKLDQFTNHSTLQLYDFITKRKARLRATSTNPQKQIKKISEIPPALLPPSDENKQLMSPITDPDVFSFAKFYDKPRDTTDCSPHLVEEYILETERGQGRIYHIKLTILQSYANAEYHGQLYVDRDYKEGQTRGSACRFFLGNRTQANRYIQQFTEIFTEDGRKSVRIIHIIPGQQHRVSFTPGMRERNATHLAAAAAAAAAAASAAVTSTTSTTTTTTVVTVPPPQSQVKITQASNTQNTQHVHQNILSNPISIQAAPHVQIGQSLNFQQIQKLTNQNASNTSQSIQVNTVSHLTSLLTNNVAAPPNVNIHQIPQGQNVIGVNVQNLGLASSNNPALQSLLTNALNNTPTTNENNLANGPVNQAVPQNASVHHQSNQSQQIQTNVQPKVTRAPMTTNPAISALVTSLMNSAQQFQVQQAAQQAAAAAAVQQTTVSTQTSSSTTSTSTQNSAIISLLNATTPLSINNNNVATNSNLNQQQKFLARKATLNLLSSRLNLSNNTLLVNNTNQSQLRVTLSSLANHIASSNSSNNAATTQSFAITNSLPQNQTYTITTPNLGNLNQNQQTFTLTPNTTSLVTQSFTISPSSNSGFTLSGQSPQPQTFTVLQPNQTNQSFTITAPVVTVGQSASQAFTITNSNSVQSQTFQINNAGTTNQTFTITTPVVTVANQFVKAQSPNQNFSNPSPTFAINTPSPQANAVFTVNSPIPNQVFTVSIPPTNQKQVGRTPNQNFTPVNNFNKNERSRINHRRMSNTVQVQNSELNKLLNERIGDKNETRLSESKTLTQVLNDNRIVVNENSSSNLGLSMPGLSALLAGTPSADNPIPGVANTSSSTLLDRLTSNSTPFTSPPPPAVQSFPQSPSISAPSPNYPNTPSNNSPLQNLTSPSVPNLMSPSSKYQGTSPNSKDAVGISSPLSSPPGTTPVSLNLPALSLQGLTGLQNVQVSIPGLAVPISLSLNVSGQHGSTQGVLMTSLPVATTTNTTTTTTASPTMVLTNSTSSTGNMLSLPVAQLMTSTVKGTNQRTTTPSSISIAQGTTQPIQLVSALQRPTNRATNQSTVKTVQPIVSRGVINAQRQAIKVTPTSTGTSHLAGTIIGGNQTLSLTAHQQFQLALQKQAQLQSLQCLNQSQKRPISPASVANKHRRRSNAADTNK